MTWLSSFKEAASLINTQYKFDLQSAELVNLTRHPARARIISARVPKMFVKILETSINFLSSINHIQSEKKNNIVAFDFILNTDSIICVLLRQERLKLKSLILDSCPYLQTKPPKCKSSVSKIEDWILDEIINLFILTSNRIISSAINKKITSHKNKMS